MKKRFGKTFLAGLVLLSLCCNLLLPWSASANTGQPDIPELMENIAASYPGNSGTWEVIGMAAYADYNRVTVHHSSAATLQIYINTTLHTLNHPNESWNPITDQAISIVVLKALGFDASKIYPVNSNTALDVPAMLRQNPVGSYTDANDAAWVLLAQLQSNLNLSTEQVQDLISLLKALQKANGCFPDVWMGPEADSYDTTGMVLCALAPHYWSTGDPYGVKTDAKDIVDRAIAGLSAAQPAVGSYGNANTDAMVVLGLAAMGISPRHTDFTKNQSLLEGLLSYVTAAQDGFKGWSGEAYDAYATKQAFLALIAASRVMDSGSPYNLFDFSMKTSTAVRATSNESGPVANPTSPNSTHQMTVYFTLKGDRTLWIPRYALTVPEDSTVYHVFEQVLRDRGYTSSGAEQGYVKSITTPSGSSLGEFSQGPNSGWLYKVNDVVATIGMKSYRLQDGDDIVWYYTEDWTKEPSSGGGSLSSQTNTVEEANNIKTEVASILDIPRFRDVPEEHWAYQYITHLAGVGILQGQSEDMFAPAAVVTRAEWVTLLARLSGEVLPLGGDQFDDVPDTAWYAPYVYWALASGIVQGQSENLFAPNDAVSRQDMAVMVVRYAQYLKQPLIPVYAAVTFRDEEQTSIYARAAVTLVQQAGLMQGQENLIFAPTDGATRAEAAKLISLLLEHLQGGRPELATIINDTAEQLWLKTSDPQPGSVGGEWAVIGLAGSGYAVPEAWFKNYYDRLSERLVEQQGILDQRKYTEYSRAILTFSVLGWNPTDVAGYDLLKPLADFDQTVAQGINGAIYALLALDSTDYTIAGWSPAAVEELRTSYVQVILSGQQIDGGFALSKGASDPDLTAMALQALAKYQDQLEIAQVTNSALAYLSAQQNEEAGFSSAGVANCESTAQVILALCELGLPLDDHRFVKNGHQLLDNLLNYYQPGSGFVHIRGDSNTDGMATEQALCALVSLQRLQSDQSSLYRMHTALLEPAI